MAVWIGLLATLALGADPSGGLLPWEGASPDTFASLETGVLWQDLQVGEGPAAQVGTRVDVHYVGMLEDGTVFDSSRERGQAFSFRIGEHRVIRGWEDGLVGAQIGTVRRLIIPASQGYGDRTAGRIPPGSTLYFEVEVLGMTAPRAVPTEPMAVSPSQFNRQGWAQVVSGDGARTVKNELVCVDYSVWVGEALVTHTYAKEACAWFRMEDGQTWAGLMDVLKGQREGSVVQVWLNAEAREGGPTLEGVSASTDVLVEAHLVTANQKVR